MRGCWIWFESLSDHELRCQPAGNRARHSIFSAPPRWSSRIAQVKSICTCTNSRSTSTKSRSNVRPSSSAPDATMV
jgi:hypothetical protein